MKNISEIFKAEASSVNHTFTCYSGVSGFRIPIYQRKYTWSDENIS